MKKLILTLSVFLFFNCKDNNNYSVIKKSPKKSTHKTVISINDTTSSGSQNTVEINGTIYKISSSANIHISDKKLTIKK